MATRGAAAVDDFETHRRALTAHCYRMLGSGSEAEDAVQETMVRAWQHAGDFEGRSSTRTWLYRIATNVCIDMSRSVQRRARPMDLSGPSRPDESLLGPVRNDIAWIGPIADDRVLDPTVDPQDLALQRESLRLAFIAALQQLPAQGRGAVILCDVLRWPAADAAELMDTTTAALNSSLQRARATLAELPAEFTPTPLDVETASLVDRYLTAFETYDLDALAGLLHADAIQTMPPFELWLQGAEDIVAWMVEPGPSGCRGSRLLPTTANGCPAFGQYRIDPNGGYAPWAIQVLEISEGKIGRMSFFLALADPDGLFPAFGLPNQLDD